MILSAFLSAQINNYTSHSWTVLIFQGIKQVQRLSWTAGENYGRKERKVSHDLINEVLSLTVDF